MLQKMNSDINQTMSTSIAKSLLKDFAIEYELKKGLSIKYRGKNLWAITNNFRSCWNIHEQKFVYEPLPSNRTEEFLNRTRFSLAEAYIYAMKILK